jgi:hypothetical protein
MTLENTRKQLGLSDVPQKPMSMEKELSRQRPLIFLQQNHLLVRIQFL